MAQKVDIRKKFCYRTNKWTSGWWELEVMNREWQQIELQKMNGHQRYVAGLEGNSLRNWGREAKLLIRTKHVDKWNDWLKQRFLEARQIWTKGRFIKNHLQYCTNLLFLFFVFPPTSHSSPLFFGLTVGTGSWFLIWLHHRLSLSWFCPILTYPGSVVIFLDIED